MPESLDLNLWPVLARFHAHRQTHSEWERGLGPEGIESVPLALAKGERADFIRCPDTGIPLGIHENWNGSFSALPPVDTELDSRIDDLTLADLRVHALGVQNKGSGERNMAYCSVMDSNTKPSVRVGIIFEDTQKPLFNRVADLINPTSLLGLRLNFSVSVCCFCSGSVSRISVVLLQSKFAV